MHLPRPLRTLIVDESEAFSACVEAWARDREEIVVVGTARSGDEALAAMPWLRPDLVLADAVLPVVDGFRLTRVLKTSPFAPLVVLATFFASEAAREQALAAGADGFLAKDDFVEGFGLLLRDLVARRAPPASVTRQERSNRPVSRTEPDP